MLVIFLPHLARCMDLTDFYTQLFEELSECTADTPIQIRGIDEAIDILLDDSRIDLKMETFKTIFHFIESFASQAGLGMIELK